MARTTSTEVELIIDTNVSAAVMNALIDTANLMVTNILGDTDLGDTTLEKIECWLTAHLIAIGWERQATDEKLGDASIKYSGVFGEGLKSTTYGQMVLMLDTSGLMSKSIKKGASLRAITSFD